MLQGGDGVTALSGGQALRCCGGAITVAEALIPQGRREVLVMVIRGQALRCCGGAITVAEALIPQGRREVLVMVSTMVIIVV